MIKIGNWNYDTVPVSKVNLKQRVPYIYPTPIRFAVCPLCGKQLQKDFVYAIQISQKECVKISGSFCHECHALFSTFRYLLTHLEGIRFDRAAYQLRLDYHVSYDKNKYKAIFKQTASVYRQFTLCTKRDIRTYTIVYDYADVDVDRGIIHYTSEIALRLLVAEKEVLQSVMVDEKPFEIIRIFRKDVVSYEIMRDIERAVSKKRQTVVQQLSDFSHTVYVYRGRLACHKSHYIEEYRARVVPFGDIPKLFYVEYCQECDKYLMEYDDYQQYLKRFRFFPARVHMYDGSFGTYCLPEKSPLMLNGYTVREEAGYTAIERQNILARIMDNHILSRHEIKYYLKWFIKGQENDPRKTNAVQKWKEDLDFVVNYRLHELPLVLIGSIERKT